MRDKVLTILLSVCFVFSIILSIYVFYLKNTIQDLQAENITLQIQEQAKEKTIQEINRRNEIIMSNQKIKQELKEKSKITENSNKSLESKLEDVFK